MPPLGNTSDFVIIGGVATGPKTAATLARRLPNASITLFEKTRYLSYASCGMPYFASGDLNRFEELTATAYGLPRDEQFFAATRGFSVLTGAEVIAIDRRRKIVQVKREGESKIIEHGYGKLVLATGSRPAAPPFPVSQSPRIRTFTRPDDAIVFRQFAEQGKIGTAVIVGAGYIGCEMAEAVGGLWGIETLLVEKEPHVLSTTLDSDMSCLVERHLKEKGIELRLRCAVNRIEGGQDGATVHLPGGESRAADFVMLCLGVVPETTLARACGLEVGSTGAIAVDDHFRTSDSDIYAGGDCAELTHRLTGEKVYLPLGSLANRHGWIIAENLAENSISYPGVLGSFLVKVFDLSIGGVGLNSRAAERAARKPAAVCGTFADRPDFYPESKTVMLKMIYDKHDGRLLGLQAVGAGDIARRVDVFSSFLHFGGTADDLLRFEHGYAPPYNEAVDPLHHVAAMVAAQRRGVKFSGPGDIAQQAGADAIWVDVREKGEQQEKPLSRPEVVAVPLSQLRAEMARLPKDRTIILVCQRGGRAYQAAVMLRDAGFTQVIVLGGGKAMLE